MGPCVSNEASEGNAGRYQRLQPLERRWRAGISLLTPAAIALAPTVAALGVPLCAFRSLADVPCPLCGGTRICAALAQGDLSVALQLNPGLLPVLGLAAVHSLLLMAEALSGRQLAQPGSLLRAWQLAGVFLMGTWLLRVLGVWPSA
jgi:hypothetical protein